MLWMLLLWLQVTVLPGNVNHVELGIFRPTISMETPFTTTQYPASLITCGHLKTEDPVDGVPNPTLMTWDDPSDVTKECRAGITTPVLSLPLGVGYRAAIRYIYNDGSSGAWSFAPYTFRRAPRGQPCANNTPGVLIVGEADINGNPVRISLCVQQ